MNAAPFTEKLQSYDAGDRDRILRAVVWVKELHEGESPKTTVSPVPSSVIEPSRLNHALEVAAILTDLNLDADTVIAAILHESLEGTAATRETIEERFGREAALMVEGVTRIADIAATNKTIQEAENIRKMLFAMVQDIRVIFIKLADKLHSMRILDAGDNGIPPEQRKLIAQECVDIYAPLAGRLGISWMKDELEDLSLKHLNRDVFNQIKEIVSLKKGERREYLDTIQGRITKEAALLGITIAVESRAKHFYSIYRKMRKRNKSTGELYDLFGIRILCDNIEHCYTLLGMVHRLWMPLDGRFKDYIAMPKANGYQSLHTTVIAFADQENMDQTSADLPPSGLPPSGLPPSGLPPAGQPFPWSPLTGKNGAGLPLEIQIRTGEMHHIAEYGIASHWLYKKGTANELIRPEDVALVNRLKDWKLAETESGRDNSESFLEDIKREILKDSIYVFTPQGKVVELPVGATPIDFAYHIHSAIGERCSGAKADGAIIPLGAELQNTQVVEILTATNARPHVNWLRIVKTAKARNKIRAWLQQNDSSLIIEKNIVAKKKEPEKPREAGAPAEPVVQRVIPQEAPDANVLHVRVQDEKNMMIHFAKCCNPVIGDPIVGYVSRGRGIIVHRRNCSNIANIPDFAERCIETEWENAAALLVKRFKVEARFSASLFSEIEGAVRKYQGHLIEGRLEETGDLRSHASHLTGFFTMQLDRSEDLRKVMKGLRSIPSIYSILSLN
ncbi:GTP pyrophosphokinase [Spirochaetia bacterium]|nr:GTP pyrophosphokinase [Spirochaetia bacterium]